MYRKVRFLNTVSNLTNTFYQANPPKRCPRRLGQLGRNSSRICREGCVLTMGNRRGLDLSTGRRARLAGAEQDHGPSLRLCIGGHHRVKPYRALRAHGICPHDTVVRASAPHGRGLEACVCRDSSGDMLIGSLALCEGCAGCVLRCPLNGSTGLVSIGVTVLVIVTDFSSDTLLESCSRPFWRCWLIRLP
ncbi:hypothetical protein F5Y13DRAFT_158384 [Hypoxylon sp. FL1857]|nr:hypothetical protein F5Y13DRAFT_158384 [Hypoxylon sp. FL1857]